MKTDTLRAKFLSFFEKHGHKVVPGAGLVPKDDPTLLFTGAGMNQFKDYFLGRVKPPASRIATSQICLRTVDMEKVGRTPGHHTFFEMLGNFSFGDYFKRETITWAWEFFLGELRLPAERLSVSVYQDDQAAYDIWHEEIGLPPEKIFKFGAEDNFWPANAPTEGPNGPCGPCSEIFYDLGSDYGCGSETCSPACDCQRFVEVWNLVFTEFDRQESGELLPLPQKNIDTGMGLERLAAVMQGVQSNFDIDIFQPLIDGVTQLLKVDYHASTEEGARIRRIADHVRSLTFIAAEGILPANDGRGYIERRILRRASRDGMTLGTKKPFLYKLVPLVIDLMKKTCPELADKHQHISRIIKTEESKFLETVDQGIHILEQTVNDLLARGEKVFPGSDAFKLYDTYGFPIDLTESILTEKGFKLDLVGYEEALKLQKTRARSSSKLAQEIFANTPVSEVKNILAKTDFVGYENIRSRVKIEAILLDGKLHAEASASPAEVLFITDKTPFYGEIGGQVGDTGLLVFKTKDIKIVIKDTQWVEDYIVHVGVVKKGTVRMGDVVKAVVDEARRRSVERNHTATHLLQYALRQVLGDHIEQSGSSVDSERLRFDFTHPEALTAEELASVEEIVNKCILGNGRVRTEEMELAKAKAQGVLAFFADKYSDRVRVVTTGDYSKELCGGTHVRYTGEIGLFKIISESSISVGVRRIEAVTGNGVSKMVGEQETLLKDLSILFDTTPSKIIKRAQDIMEELKTTRQQLSQYQDQANISLGQTLLSRAKTTAGVKVVSEIIKQKDMDDLRSIADQLKASPHPSVALLAAEKDGRVNLILTVSAYLVERGFDAVSLIKDIAAMVGGSGGGRKDLAQAGGKDLSRLPEAMDHFVKLVSKQLG